MAQTCVFDHDSVHGFLQLLQFLLGGLAGSYQWQVVPGVQRLRGVVGVMNGYHHGDNFHKSLGYICIYVYI